MHIILEFLFSFTCTVGFGIVFGIRRNELYIAGIAGLLTRAVLIVCESMELNRLAYTLIAALIGTVFAEIVGRRRKESIAKYMYPALVMLIPGDVLYNLIVAMVTVDQAAVSANTLLLGEALFGIAVGCMIGPVPFRAISQKIH